MKICDLSPQSRAKLGACRYDQIIEKHEGPWRWDDALRNSQPEFLSVNDHDVLLPIEREQHTNITILRVIKSSDGQVLTIFLCDTTYYSGRDSGFLAICERVLGETFFIATVYHEWFYTDYSLG